MFLAYLFFLVWLGVTAFTSLPVFMYFNVWSMCKNTSLVEGANLCLDLRQFGESKLGSAFAGGQPVVVCAFTGVLHLSDLLESMKIRLGCCKSRRGSSSHVTREVTMFHITHDRFYRDYLFPFKIHSER